jgi:hypothetical protein
MVIRQYCGKYITELHIVAFTTREGERDGVGCPPSVYSGFFIDRSDVCGICIHPLRQTANYGRKKTKRFILSMRRLGSQLKSTLIDS